MKAAWASALLESYHDTTHCNNPEDLDLNITAMKPPQFTNLIKSGHFED